jgi:hypothetical protein
MVGLAGRVYPFLTKILYAFLTSLMYAETCDNLFLTLLQSHWVNHSWFTEDVNLVLSLDIFNTRCYSRLVELMSLTGIHCIKRNAKIILAHFATVFRPSVVVMWLTLLLRIGRSQVQISAWRPAILTEDFRDFPVSLQVNAGTVP